MTSTAPRQAIHATTSRAAIGSQTQTEPNSQSQAQPGAILRLRGAHLSRGRSVQWREDVVDNEGLGRKNSKVCCIYHRPRAVDESSDESSSSSSDNSASQSDAENYRAPRKIHKDPSATPAAGDAQKRGSNGHSDTCHQDQRRRGRQGRSRRGLRLPSPNAYEKMPKPKAKDGGDGQGEAGAKPLAN